ncbi:glycosyltransferase family 4 protein [Flavobacterium sp. PL02]|uniref:glycosyltransferase family 4 protein n=1 Tax=Flavobacterium sp. PL02 TaxID=3088354 RepID=UPI002B222F88|nr:glycosyltransferase family 4 protein [Flavobacterium sp. PL02]MEA9412460.1 glycosyltransferase family 4 protein [Flavobacterium sp. PL02]
MRVIAIHLLNDYSGSPKVLKQLLAGWAKKGVDLHLYTCSGREGFLSGLPDVKYHFYWYKFMKNPLLRLLFLTSSQFLLAFKLLFSLKKNDVVYINTVLPFGAAIAGKIRGNKVIYHVHETSMKPLVFKKFLFGVLNLFADEVVYVSNFLANKEPVNIKKRIIYNVLEEDFVKLALANKNQEKEKKIVLMICSLKGYKGVNEFLELAQTNPGYIFKLVVNATIIEIQQYFNAIKLPENLFIYPTQTDTHSFYSEASVVLNLSDPKLWVETFGLTILEAMAYGLPTIVPPVGGVTELVIDGKNGYLIESKRIDKISDNLKELLENKVLYKSMSNNAFEMSKLFSLEYFEKQSAEIIFQYMKGKSKIWKFLKASKS